jgi:hypothetical protein
MKLIPSALIALSCLTLVACGESTDEESGSGGGVTGNQPDWNRYDENAEAADGVAADMSGTTRVDTAPTQDTASMSGAFGIQTDAVEAASGKVGAIVGEMTMEADFGEGTVEGKLYNTFLDYGSTHDPLTGTVNYDGTVTIASGETDSTVLDGAVPDNTDIIANGTQTLTAPDGSSYNIYLDIFGDVHEIPNDPVVAGNPITVVDGLLEGNVTITDADSVTDPLIYDIDGTYIVHEDE